MLGLEITGRAPSQRIHCAKCGADVGTVQLPQVSPKTAKLLNGSLSLMLDATVNINELNPNVLSEAVGLLCLRCTMDAPL